MSEYKENTVGWWLSQLKEPLRSQSFEDCDKQFLNDLIDEIHDGMYQALQCVWLSTRVNKGFWRGTMIYWLSIIKRDILFAPDWKDCRRDNCDDSAQEGWDMAKECAPDNWLKPKDGGEDKAIVDSPAPELIVTGAMIEDFGKMVNYPPTREIEAPERAVVGYEEPKPIDTIKIMEQDSFTILPTPESEKIKEQYIKDFMAQNPLIDIYDHEGNLAHPSRISALEARVMQLEGVVGKLEQQIEYVYRNLPKDFDGTR